MKLHLGCGAKYFKGYINVDGYDYEGQDTSRTDSKYDIKAYLQELPFKNNSIEEILLVHVIEHFCRWKTIDLIKDFKRILKIGGRLIVEMPDLEQVAKLYVKHGRHGWRQIKTPLGKLSMAATQFYGNQWDSLEYETHRYLWEKQEFADELIKIGFKIEELHNQTKFHVPERDLRCIAIK